MKMDKEVRRSFERKNLERAAKKAAVVGLTTLVLSTSGIQANAASRYDNSNYRGIGYISKVEEVSELGNGGYISTGAGDYGGVSYGIYQFSTTTGSARDFINWTKKNDQEVYKYFKAEGNPRPSTAAFNRAWKKAYKELGTKFEKSQYNFASEYLIKPAYNRVKKRFGLDLKKSRAREEYLISTAVQFGPGGICNLFKEVENRGIKLDDNMDDSELLSIMCNHKRDTVAYHFRSSSAAVKAAARQRFIREKKELLKISKEESGKTLDEMKETKTNTTKVSSSKEINDTSTEEFDDVIAVDDKDIEKDYDKVEKELDEIKDTISNETQDNTESKDEEDKATTEDEDTSKEETTDEETSKDESAKEDKAEEKDNTESDTKEETKDEDKQETTAENGSSLDNTLFVGDSHMKGAESTIKNNYDNSQVKATVGASAYVYLHDTKFFGEKLINSLPEDSDDIHQVVVSLGVNNITGATNESDVIKVLEKLQAKYPGKPIRFMLVNHVGNKYTEASVSKTNKLIDNLNKTITNYAKEHENVSVIDASEGLETNGKLTSTNDGLHVNNNKKLLNNIEKGVEEKQDKTTLEEAPDQVKTTDEFDSIVDEDTTKDIEEPDKATEEDNDKQESSKEDKVEEKDNDTKEETSKEDKQESTSEETKDNTEKEDKESDTKEESKDEDKSTESEKESSKEETTTEDNTVEEDNNKQETSKDESTKEDKSEEEKDYDTKEESSVKEDKQESTSEETKDNTEKESSKEDNTVEEDKESDTKEESTKEDKTEDKSEEKAVEQKQETSKEETPVKENKSTKEDKVEEKDNTVKETKEETPAKEDKHESTEKESSKDESVKENKVEEKAVEQKQESSKEKEQPVQEEKTTEKQETKTEDNSKQEDNSTEQSSDTLNELQSRLSNNLFGKLMS